MGLLVIVVDDGSGEAYQQIFSDLEPSCIVLHHRVNRGKGEALKTGLFFVEENLPECGVLGTMNCDGQHLPKDMLRVLDAAREHQGELVLGSRNTEEMPLRSKIGGRLAGRAFARRWGGPCKRSERTCWISTGESRKRPM